MGVGFVVVGAPSLGVGFAVIIDAVGCLDGNNEPFCQPSSSQTSRLLLLLLLLDDESLLALDVTDSLLDLLCFVVVVVVLSDELSSSLLLLSVSAVGELHTSLSVASSISTFVD